MNPRQFYADIYYQNYPILHQLYLNTGVPLGLIKRTQQIHGKVLNVIVDSSGSMTESSAVLAQHASPYLYRTSTARKLTRWEDVQDRLHKMIDQLAYIPTADIVISFFDPITMRKSLRPDGYQNPEEFKRKAHAKIRKLFKSAPSTATPLLRKIKKELQDAAKTNFPTVHIVFTDGVPSDYGLRPSQVKQAQLEIASILENRADKHLNEFIFQSCSDNAVDTKWMKEDLDQIPLVAEDSNYEDELEQIVKVQGEYFRRIYTRGFHEARAYLDSSCPELDKLDEEIISRAVLEDILGHSVDDYYTYYSNTEFYKLNANKYEALYPQYSVAYDFSADQYWQQTQYQQMAPVMPYPQYQAPVYPLPPAADYYQQQQAYYSSQYQESATVDLETAMGAASLNDAFNIVGNLFMQPVQAPLPPQPIPQQPEMQAIAPQPPSAMQTHVSNQFTPSHPPLTHAEEGPPIKDSMFPMRTDVVYTSGTNTQTFFTPSAIAHANDTINLQAAEELQPEPEPNWQIGMQQ